jgi:hypothetical protein
MYLLQEGGGLDGVEQSLVFDVSSAAASGFPS